MPSRRAFLAAAVGGVSVTAGCSVPLSDPDRPEYHLGEVYVQSRLAEPCRATVAVEESGGVVFLDSAVASPAEWDGDDLRREGGVVFSNPVDGPRAYTVAVRIDDGPVHRSDGGGLTADDDCLSLRPTVERDGDVHFAYAYDDMFCGPGTPEFRGDGGANPVTRTPVSTEGRRRGVARRPND